MNGTKIPDSNSCSCTSLQCLQEDRYEEFSERKKKHEQYFNSLSGRQVHVLQSCVLWTIVKCSLDSPDSPVVDDMHIGFFDVQVKIGEL